MAASEIKHIFDQEVLNKLIENRLGFYKVQEATATTLGAIEYVSVDNPVQMLNAYAEKVAAGYTLAENLPVNAHTINGVGLYSFYVLKPQHMQDADIEIITAEVTDQYNAERKRLYDEHLAFIVQTSLEREKREQERKAAAAAEKARTKFEAEALAALGEFK